MPELAALADELSVENAAGLRKQDLIFAILKAQARKGEKIKGEVAKRISGAVKAGGGSLTGKKGQLIGPLGEGPVPGVSP